jgi:hypothetical protein
MWRPTVFSKSMPVIVGWKNFYGYHCLSGLALLKTTEGLFSTSLTSKLFAKTARLLATFNYQSCRIFWPDDLAYFSDGPEES